MRKPLLPLWFLPVLWPAIAVGEPEAQLAARPPERLWAAGFRGGYTNVPNFALGSLFERYVPVNGYFLEGIAARRFKSFTLYASLSVTRAGADTGVWQRGPTRTPNEVALDLVFLSADALFDWEVRLHRVFAFHFGAGVGLGFAFGTVKSKECMFTSIGICQPVTVERDRLAEDGWPIYPVLHLVAGTRIDLAPRLSLRVDFDFRNAFGFALGVFYEI